MGKPFLNLHKNLPLLLCPRNPADNSSPPESHHRLLLTAGAPPHSRRSSHHDGAPPITPDDRRSSPDRSDLKSGGVTGVNVDFRLNSGASPENTDLPKKRRLEAVEPFDDIISSRIITVRSSPFITVGRLSDCLGFYMGGE